jgi:hypothetical protein
MKNILHQILVIFILLLSGIAIAQAQVPQKFNYQGIARDAKGNPLGEKQLALKISVLPTADATVADYVETQQVSTNEFGLYTLQIGGGTPLLGDMKTVKWETGNKYIQVAIDPLGGTQYEVVGTTQLLSVPYAIYADKAGQARETVNNTGGTRAGNVSTSAAGTGTVNYLTKFVAANTIYNSQIVDNGNFVGIGTATPAARLHISTTGGNQEHLRMENLNPVAWGKFIFYNNNAVDYHTFTKYGTGIGGNYGGLTGFPYASLMVFGSNTAPTMVANANNIGFSLNYGSVAKLKYYAHHATGNVGIGGNATPAANVHINSTDYTGDTLKITNTTSGHTAADGLDIRMSGLAASVMNRENSTLSFGTNNASVVTITPTGTTELTGQIKIAGGVPGAGKVLTSDATGLASWQNPTGGGSYTAGTGINIVGSTISNTGDLSNTNEIQTLSIAGSNLSLSNGGGTVTIPTGSASYVAGTGISITGSTIANTGDLSATNEIQTMTLTGNALTLSAGGGTVNIPSYTAGSGISISGTTVTNTGDLSATNELQTMTLTGNNLTLSNGGGTITLPSGGGGVTSVNGATGAVTNSLTLGSAGTSPAITGSGTNAVTLNLPIASATNTGVLSSANWSAFNSKASTAGGINNFVAKYTPNGTTLGNSGIKDSNGHVLFNANVPGTNIQNVTGNVDYLFRGNKMATVINKNLAQENQLILTNSNGQFVLLGDSTQLQTSPYDSAASITNLVNTKIMHMGSINLGLNVDLRKGRIFNGAYNLTPFSNANFTIGSIMDTAGYFYSTSNNWLNNGILRAEYLGAGVDDHIGIFGKVLPDVNSNYGIGILGEGGYRGITGVSSISSVAENIGGSFQAFNNGNNYGVYGLSSSSITPGGIKYGVYGNAGDGDDNIGVGGLADPAQLGNGWGGYFQGKQTGVFGTADSASAAQTYWFGTAGGNEECIGVYGVSTASFNSSQYTISTGVAGSSRGLSNYYNIGMFCEAEGGLNNIGLYAYAPTGPNDVAGLFSGDVDIYGNLSKTGGTFKIDHPQDPANKYLIHSFVESPDMMNIYNGNIVTDANGYATVELPSYFEAENMDFKYQLTVIDNSADFVQSKVTRKITANTFEIRTSKPGVEVSWMVTGVRQDVWANANRVIPEVEKSARDKGLYIHPELFNQPSSLQIGRPARNASEARQLTTPKQFASHLAESKRNHVQRSKENGTKEAAARPVPTRNTPQNSPGSLMPSVK